MGITGSISREIWTRLTTRMSSQGRRMAFATMVMPAMIHRSTFPVAAAEDRAGDAEEDRLRGDRVDGAEELPRREDEQHREEEQRPQDVDEAGGQLDAHSTLSASARKAHTSPSPRNCGTRKKRSLA